MFLKQIFDLHFILIMQLFRKGNYKLSRNSLNKIENLNKKSRFKFHTFTSLQYHDFRFLITSTFFTSAGNWIQQVTLGWLAYEYTNSAFLTGAVTGIRALPFLFMGPIAGVITDRMDRKRLLIALYTFYYLFWVCHLPYSYILAIFKHGTYLYFQC